MQLCVIYGIATFFSLKKESLANNLLLYTYLMCPFYSIARIYWRTSNFIKKMSSSFCHPFCMKFFHTSKLHFWGCVCVSGCGLDVLATADWYITLLMKAVADLTSLLKSHGLTAGTVFTIIQRKIFEFWDCSSCNNWQSMKVNIHLCVSVSFMIKWIKQNIVIFCW